MRRRDALLFAAGATFAWPFIAGAQQAGKTWRVGFLDAGPDIPARRANFDAFRRRMGELGYIEGRNLAYLTRFAEGRFERLPELVQELIAADPDALLVATTPGAKAGKAATLTVPIVLVSVADPVGVGLVQSLARPGGNLTGITNIQAELTGKRLEILKEIVPAASRVAVVINPDDPNATVQLRNAEAAARSLQIELRPVVEVRGADDLEPAFARAVPSTNSF
jgi:putative ABC transport system substrate-binding protein